MERRRARARTSACGTAATHYRGARLRPALLLALVVVASTSTAQPASGSATSVTVSAGTLHLTAPAISEFDVVVNGATQVVEAPLEPFSVVDARGSGGGWTLTVQATPFREWDGSAYVAGGNTLPHGSLRLDGLSVTAEGTDADLPRVFTGPTVVDGETVTVATAGAGAGMGLFAFASTGPLRVSIPANVPAGVYRSELSLSVTAGP